MVYRVLRRSILVASAALIVLLNHPEVVGCQIGHPDMEVGVFGSSATKDGEVAPSYEFWLPLVGGCGVYYDDRPNRDYLIKGNLGADFVKGGSDADTMYGGDGNDKAGGGPGNDTFYGGAGNEHLSGGEGEDEIHGGEGDDIDLDGDHANDLLYGGSGDDGGAPTSENLQHHGLCGEGGEIRVYGEEGADTIDAQASVEVGGAREEISGGDGDDTITAADGLVDVIDCGLGLDTVVSYDRGSDVLVDC